MKVKLIDDASINKGYAQYLFGMYDELQYLFRKYTDAGEAEVLAQYIKHVHVYSETHIDKHNLENPWDKIDKFSNELFYVIKKSGRVQQLFNVPAFFCEVTEYNVPDHWMFQAYQKGINVPNAQRNDYGLKYPIYAIWGPERFVLDNEYTFNLIYGYDECTELE